MHVGLNLIYLVPGEIGGMETYARELIPALAEARPDLQLTCFVNRHAAATPGPWRDHAAAVTVPVDARNRVEWVRGEQQILPRLAGRAGVELVHSLASTAPAWGRFRRVVTIHDLIYRHIPEAHFGVRTLGMRVLVPLAARRSDRVIAISQSTAEDLRRLLRVPDGKIDVVPQGLGAPAAADPLPEPEVRRRHDLGERPLLLTLSAKRPAKNLPRLLDALARIPPERRPVLALPGYRTPYEEELRRRARELGLEGDVRIPGWLDAREIEGLWRTAAAFVFPSLYEGFGFPVLEAMHRGVPVACSDRSSLPEVADEAALLFDPEDPQAIAAAIERLLVDRDMAATLVERGRLQAARFTWRRTAERTIASYERALSGR